MDTDIASGAALQHLCSLAQSSKGKAVAMIVQQALGHPSVFVFEELIEVPSVQQLADGPDKATLDLLKVFAYGTYADYKANQANLPALTPNQELKLKKLTIVSLSSERRTIPYNDLLRQLDINNVRELEDLIIDCIYQGIIKGRLDQKSSHLEIDFAIGRDLRPGQLETMMETLINWNQKAETLLKSIDEKIQFATLHQQQAKEAKKAYEDKLEAVRVSASHESHTDLSEPGGFDDDIRSRKKSGRKGASRKAKGYGQGYEHPRGFN